LSPDVSMKTRPFSGRVFLMLGAHLLTVFL
jgi:hypothetical protein